MKFRWIGFSLLMAAAALWPAMLPVTAQNNSDNVRGFNGRVLRYQAAMRRANAAEAAAIRAEAAPVFAQRAAALTALIRENPGAALGLAFSRELRDELASDFPDAASSLERQGEWEGTSDHLIFDDPARQVRRYQVQIQSGNDGAEVYSAGGEPHCVSGNTLLVKGVRVGNVIAAGSTSVKSGGAAVAGAGCSTTGAQNAAILLVQFPGVTLPASVTPSGVWDIFFSASGRSVTNYWNEASYGKASATGNVFGPYTLDRVYSCDEYNQMRTAAIAAADPDVHFPNYTRLFIVFPDPGSCGWAGLGSLGCGSLSSADGTFTASTSWLLATYMGSRDNGVKLSTHEGGHNLTLHHASSRDYAGEPLGPVGSAGTLGEYGDPFSTMGSWNFGHYGAPHKVQMGWLGSSNVVTTETNGSYSIQPYEQITGGVQALKVRRGTGNDAWLWLEYRQPLGQYDSALNSQIFNGALVHYQDSTTGTHTHLLDFNKSTSTYSDAALTGSYVDPYSNVSVSVTGATSSALSVNVFYGPVPCVRATPAVTLSPPNPSVYSGAQATYTVTILNNDTSGCLPTSFDLGSTAPAGWGTAFSSYSLTVNPGQSASATMTKDVPAGTTPGTYAVNAGTSDSDHAAAGGSANITVVAPPEPLFVALTATPSAVKVRSSVTLNAVVTKSGGVPVNGASVTFVVTRPGGSTSKTVKTNASGVATYAYKPTQKGTYSAMANASSGASSGSGGPVTFTAN
ncbi:MAG TPA: Ig-like domain-containing protein [Terriglobia bacterium]|nr:Ig-like domain-containing protein [Terriglobia bacterium]